MLLTNNGSYTNRNWRAMTSNGREDNNVTAKDIDFDGTSGGAPAPKPDPDPKPDPKPDPVDVEKLLSTVENDSLKDLDEEQVTNLLKDNEGVGFDKDGNIVDVEGKVVKPFDEYKDSLESSDGDPLAGAKEIEIDDVKYKLDDQGNALGEDGKVFKTKEELVEMLNDEGDQGGDDDNYISQISSVTGFQALDDKGEPIEFENTVEGLAAREAHIVKQEATKLAQQELETFFSKNPDVYEMVNYKNLHGSLDGYGSRTDYSKVSVDESNDDQHRSLIIEAEMAQGKDESRAKTIADMLIGDGKGKDEAEASLKYLQDKQTADEQAAIQKKQKEEDSRIQQQKEFAEDVAKVVSKGEANGFTIPKYFQAKTPDGKVTTLSRDAIYYFVTEPVTDDGKTRYDLMAGNDSVESKVLDAYMRMTGYDFNKLASQKSKNDTVLKLKNAKKSAKSKVNVVRQQAGFDDSDLDFS